MEYLESLLASSDLPVISAFILGLMTALSPCPMAANITATAYLSKDIENKRKVVLGGLIYTFGRMLSYSLLGLIIALGASKFQISTLFQKYGEALMGPLLLLMGLFMLDVIKITSKGGFNFVEKVKAKFEGRHYLSALFLGMAFALAFCPYSGALYFAMLIPLTLGAGAEGFLLPPVFAIGTGIPVILVSIIIAYGLSSIGNIFNKITVFEYWFRKIVGGVFLLAGLYYILILFKVL
ncbi:MAG: sulfite exporter TauE/SafE family protein [Chlorobi bacterium]|nr:sulfite exporter TauE/SafE family protein [Chlorobiota bacterium]